MKNYTDTVTEPATFRFVTQCLNEPHHGVLGNLTFIRTQYTSSCFLYVFLLLVSQILPVRIMNKLRA